MRLRDSNIWLVVLWLLLMTTIVSADPFSGTLAVVGLIHLLTISAITAAVSFGLSKLAQHLRKPPAGATSTQAIRLSTSRYGEVLPWIGGWAAAGAKVIYAQTPPTQRVVTTNVGSGKRKTSRTDTVYSTSWGVAVCPNYGNSILGVTKVWMSDKLVISLEQTDVSALDGTIATQMAPFGGTGGNNYTAGFGGGQQIYGGYARRFKICLGREDQTVDDIATWYTDSHSGYVPGYRGVVTIWWDDMALAPFYNALPQIVVEVLNSDNTIELIYGRWCELSGLSSGQIDTGGYGLTYVNGVVIDQVQSAKDTFEVLSIAYPFSVAEVDSKLSLVQLGISSNATVGTGELAAVSGGIEDGQKKDPKVLGSIAQVNEFPARVEVSYMDRDRRYQQSSVGYSRQQAQQQGVRQLTMPLVLTGDEARKVSQQALSVIWDERFTLKGTLPPKYFQYCPGDRLTIPLPDGSSTAVMRITDMNFAPGEPMEVSGVRVAQLLVNGATAGSGGGVIGGGPPDDTTVPTIVIKPLIATVLWISNAPPALDEDDDTDGFNIAVAPKVVQTTDFRPWTGATVYRNACGSDDSVQEYEPIAQINEPALIGKAKTVLPSATAYYPTLTPDTTNTFDVEFPYGVFPGPVGLSNIEPDAWAKTTTSGLMFVGKEILQFRTITDVSATYGYDASSGRAFRFSNLKRGVRDTQGSVGSHVLDEAVVMWNRGTVARVEMNVNEQDNSWNFKAATLGTSDADTPVPAVADYTPWTNDWFLVAP